MISNTVRDNLDQEVNIGDYIIKSEGFRSHALYIWKVVEIIGSKCFVYEYPKVDEYNMYGKGGSTQSMRVSQKFNRDCMSPRIFIKASKEQIEAARLINKCVE